VLRKFAKPLCLIAPEFEPDRLPHCALPTHSAVGPISAVMEFSRKPLFPHRWKVLGISQQQSSKRLSSELGECHRSSTSLRLMNTESNNLSAAFAIKAPC